MKTIDKRLRLALIYDDFLDPRDRKSWSGLPYYILNSFKKYDVDFVHIHLSGKSGFLRRWLTFLYHRFITRERYLRDRDHGLLKDYARQIERALCETEVDAAFGWGSTPYTFVNTTVPLIFWSDATFLGVAHFYESFSKLVRRSMEEGLASERLALANVDLAIYASDWAAETAITQLGADPACVKVIPFGANLDHVPSAADIQKFIEQKSRATCRILFSGVDWARKGADIAVETALALDRMGIATELTIIGCHEPEGTTLPAFVEVKGFISKDTADGRKQINDLLEEAHFLILPSRAEAFGVVFCEASAMGVPCLATNVGGIATAVRTGVNGQLFDVESDGEDFATFISKLWHDRAAYEALAYSSYLEYNERLNWDVSSRKALDYIRQLTTRKHELSPNR